MEYDILLWHFKRTSCSRVTKGHTDKLPASDNVTTLEVLDDKFGFKGIESKAVWAILRNPMRNHLIVVFRGSCLPLQKETIIGWRE